ncbi:GNAT family N-acetyltransferase [Halobacteria archaeon AArc-curdl1]|uniref:GNAT family N-acetyltransferase n=1 Tax=Natronosalvus hydrolyticus TaxID=2979988 RepID=A0AAP3E698_9EURY|nr:GNAT family N-acetyltransferase [Halobacteria archaeon AArc-curdl1]
METAFSIREADTGDAEAIQSVARKSWHAAYDDFLGADTVGAIIDEWYALESLRSSIRASEHHIFVATKDSPTREDSKLMGFVHGGPWADEPRIGHLMRLYVRPDSWGRGIGTSLLERAETALEGDGYERIRLEVFAENSDGVEFYEARGYDRADEECETLGGQTRRLLILETGLE